MKRLLLVLGVLAFDIGWPFGRDAYRFSKVGSELKRAPNIESAKHRLRQLLYIHGVDSVRFMDRDGSLIEDSTDAYEHPERVSKMEVIVRYTGQSVDVVHVDHEMIREVFR